MGLGSDAEESGDEGVDGDEEEEGGVHLDADYKRVSSAISFKRCYWRRIWMGKKGCDR